jgi:hypothetical protein
MYKTEAILKAGIAFIIEIILIIEAFRTTFILEVCR